MKKPVRGNVLEGSEAIEAHLEIMERKFDRLRSMYESYFMGIERTAPAVPRREMNRLMLEMQQVNIQNAGLRFRFKSLAQKWVLFIAYWNRTLREIEQGTYVRDIAKVNRHLAQKGAALTEEEAVRLGIPANRVKAVLDRQQRMFGQKAGGPAVAEPAAPDRKPVSPSAAEPAAPPPAPGGPPGGTPVRAPGPDPAELRRVYERYVEAHRRSGDARPPASFEKLSEKLTRDVQKLMQEKRYAQVGLDVALEDGKVRFKVIPKKA